MTDLLWQLIPGAYLQLLSLESIRSHVLNLFFIGITFLLSSPGVMVTIALVYWCVNKPIGRGVSYAMIFSARFNQWLKDLWQIPRPYEASLVPILDQAGISRRIEPLLRASVGSASFPSGHSQGVVVLWGYLAARFRRSWLWFLALCLVGLIPFSRMYVGVHFLQDVIAGLLLGIGWLVIWLLLESRLGPGLARLSRAWRYGLAVAVPVAGFLFHPVPAVAGQLGTLTGLGIGFVLEESTLRFEVGGPWWQRILRGLLGIGLIFGFNLLQHLASHPEPVAAYSLPMAWDFISYAGLGFFLAWVVPWLFIRLGLMSGA